MKKKKKTVVRHWLGKERLDVRRNNANEYPDGVRRQRSEYHYKLVQRLKEEVFSHYGNGKIECACCGEDDMTFLCIDHVNGDGAAHRRAMNVRGANMYRWLKKSGYPEGFQVLCHNCNFAKSHTRAKRCPHTITYEV